MNENNPKPPDDASENPDVKSLVEKAGAENLVHVPPGKVVTGGGVPGGGAAKPHHEVSPEHQPEPKRPG